MNHYVELTNHKLMGGGTVLICLEDITLLRDPGTDGVGISLRNGDKLECTDSYESVFALLDEAVQKETI